MQVQTALPQEEKQVFLTKVQHASEEPTQEVPLTKVPISTLRKKRNLRTAEEIDTEILAMREEWDRGF
jgi:hypothetical protein